MRFLRLALWVVSFVLVVTPAHAGIIGAAFAWLSTTLAGGGIVAGLIKAALGIALQVGASLLQKAFAKKQPVPGIKTSLDGGGDAPLSFIAGYYATAGHLTYVNTWGSSGKTPNAYLTMVIALSDLPVSSLRSRVWINGEPCTIDFGATVTDKGYPVIEYRKGSTDYMWVKAHDGTQTTADSFLTGKFSGDANRPWSTDMIGRGVAYVIVTMLLQRELYSGIPSFVWEVDGVKLYDIRKDTSAGGSGSHRWSNPATWEATDNPVVIAYNLVRGVYHDGEWVFGGQDLAENRLPASSWIAAANECDVAIDLAGGGTEAQYRAGLEIACDGEPLSYVDELLKSCSGRMAEIGGIYKIRVGAPAAVYSFSDDDVIVTDGQTFEPFPGLEETYNGAHATYPEPEEAWASKDAPPRYSATWEAEDDGRRLVADLSYAAAPYATQVQRLMASAIAEARRFRRHTLTLPPDAWLLEPGDIVSWTSDRNGYTAKSFMIAAMDGGPAMNQVVALVEVDPSDYDWDSEVDELPVETGYLGPIVPPAQEMTGWTVEPWTIYDGDSVARRPTVRVSFDGDLDDVRAVQVQIRRAATGAVELDGEVPYGTVPATTKQVIINATLLSETGYEVRGRFIPYSARDTEWSAWIAVTTPAVTAPDVSVTLQALGSDVYDAMQEAYRRLQSLEEEVERLGVSTAEFGGWQFERHLVQVTFGNAQASALTLLSASVDTIGDTVLAQAASITAVEARTNYGTASGLAGWYAVSGPGDVSARYVLRGRVTEGGASTEGGMYLDILTAGGARVTFDVDKFVIMNGTTGVVPFAVSGADVLMQNVRLGTLYFDQLQSTNGKLIIKGSGTNASIEVFS